jgi:hypothetical protein
MQLHGGTGFKLKAGFSRQVCCGHRGTEFREGYLQFYKKEDFFFFWFERSFIKNAGANRVFGASVGWWQFFDISFPDF